MKYKYKLKLVQNIDGEFVYIKDGDTELDDVPIGEPCIVTVCGRRVKRFFKENHCLYCGDLIKPRYSSSKRLGHWHLITTSKHKALKYCSSSCAASYNMDIKLGKINKSVKFVPSEPIDIFLTMRLTNV